MKTKNIKDTIKQVHRGSLALYKFPQETIKNGRMLIYVKVDKQGNVVVSERVTRTNIGWGKILPNYVARNKDSEWEAQLRVSDIHSEFVSEEGKIGVFIGIIFKPGNEDVLSISQTIPRYALNRIKSSLLCYGHSRTKKLDGIPGMLAMAKEQAAKKGVIPYVGPKVKPGLVPRGGDLVKSYFTLTKEGVKSGQSVFYTDKAGNKIRYNMEVIYNQLKDRFEGQAGWRASGKYTNSKALPNFVKALPRLI